MENRISTDLQLNPSRRLQKRFGSSDKAVGNGSPNALNSNLPSVKDAMGVTGVDGILSFIVSGGGAQDFSIYTWNALWNKMNPAKGWVLFAESTALNTKNVLPDSNCSVKIGTRLPYFIQAGTNTVDEILVADAGPHPSNPNTDKSITL